MWNGNKLMYVGRLDPHCSETFGKLPVEMIALIESFCIGEPYIEPTEKTDVL